MKYPTLCKTASSREMLDVFRGYNHNLRTRDGEFFDMKNLTSDNFPVLTPRGKRGVYASPEKPTGMIAKDSLCYTDGTYFVINGYRVDMKLNDEPKQLISMGAYVIIMPDKKWINTKNLEDHGSIEANWESVSDVSFALCSISGDLYSDAVVSANEPEAPENMALWIDTSSTPHTLKQYSSASAVWVSIATTYIKISAPGIGKAFDKYDGITISGSVVESLNGSAVIWELDDDFIVVVGILDEVITQPAEKPLDIRRQMPNMDYVIESENRLWGCRYGPALNGEIVNEIYASKLGDFKNWNCFMGISTDSYAVSCGTDGPFTGAIAHRGFPLFFKENYVHKVYGDYPANYKIQTTACRGVQKGSHNSLAIVNEDLFYKSRSGIMVYDGSLPTEVSEALGNVAYNGAVGGAHGNKYYVSMMEAGGSVLLVYDTAKGMWHKEDDLQSMCFCSCDGELYAIDAASKRIITMLGSGEKDAPAVEWMAQTGEMMLSSPDMKYISRLTLRMTLEPGAKVDFYIRYDLDDFWTHAGSVVGTSLRSFSLPIRPRRCDYMSLRIVGNGPAKIYSITKTIEGGSEIS